LHDRRADLPSDADLVAPRLTTTACCVGGWHMRSESGLDG
jgi:hypothetical protein